MALDMNDAKDKAAVDKIVADAIAEATEGLVTKRDELLKEVKDLKKKLASASPEDVAKLTEELDNTKTALEKANTDLKASQKEAGKTAKTLDAETAFSRNLLIENGLTEALVKANVAKEFLPAVKAMIAPKAQIKVEGDSRKVLIGDKELGAYVTEWSQGDEGKHFVSANQNGGSGANGGGANGGAKTITRAVYDQNPAAYGKDLAKGALTVVD